MLRAHQTMIGHVPTNMKKAYLGFSREHKNEKTRSEELGYSGAIQRGKEFFVNGNMASEMKFWD